MNKQLGTCVSLVVFGVSVCFVAQSDSPVAVPMDPSAPAKAAPPHPIYLTGQERAWRNFPKAPALGSAVDEDDLLITLAAQAARTDDQKNEATTDQHYSITLITSVIDPDFETKYPATFGVLKDADTDASVIISMLKKENGRLRPYVQHPTLVIPLFTVKDFSYPSGHASGSQLQARILGLLFPDRADDLLKRARQVADSRVIAGVHYASDTEAGENLGDLIFKQLEANPRFKRNLAAAAQKDNLTLK
jgi:acid phosphatase (class A)